MDEKGEGEGRAQVGAVYLLLEVAIWRDGLAVERDTGIHGFLWTFPFNAHMFDGPGRSGCIGMKDKGNK